MADTVSKQANSLSPENIWAHYRKQIIYVGAAILLILAGYFAYQELIKNPKEQEASEAIFQAESLFDKMAADHFSKDSSILVLNGGDLNGLKITGVLKVISNYGGTPSGNRAKYIAGATYLHINEFDKAIKYLKDFDGNGADQVQTKAYILLGHAYAEQNKNDDALSYYKKAAEVNKKDDAMASDALLTAASFADVLGKKDDAKKMYIELRDNYPAHTAVRSGDVDKYLARLGVFKQ